jgi:transcriptional regulator with XRE-family HTH domain
VRLIAAQGAEIVVVQRLETGFGIDLGGRKIQVAEELLDLVVSESTTNEPVGLVSGYCRGFAFHVMGVCLWEKTQMNTETKGSFRRLTKEEIAQAVKRFRKSLDMKQYTLAVEAGIDERTVQRIEAGNEVSDESLARIAKVFGGAADLFTAPRLIMTEEQAEEQAAQLSAQYLVIEAKALTTLEHCDEILGLDGVWPCTRWAPEECAELVASFLDNLSDWTDCASGGTYSERLNACRSILTEAQELHATGVRILFGIYRTDDKFRVLAVTFLPESDVHTHGIKQLKVPRSFFAGLRGEVDAN